VAAARDGVFRRIELCELADWLRLDVGELEWFADFKGLESVQAVRARALSLSGAAKNLERSGSLRYAKAAPQEFNGDSVRDSHQIPPHPAAHGFVKGRAIPDTVAPACWRTRLSLNMDLQDFFPSLSGRFRFRHSFARGIRYPEMVAICGRHCTNAAIRPESGAELGQGIDRVQPTRSRRACILRPQLCRKAADFHQALANGCAISVIAGCVRSRDRGRGVPHAMPTILPFLERETFEKCVERFARIADTRCCWKRVLP